MKGITVKKLVISAIALLLLAACGQQAAEQEVAAAAKEPVSGIDTAGMDLTVRPGDDFFAYMNGTWVAETEIPADKAGYGTFDLLRDESQENVKVIIEESASGDFAKGTDEQKVGDLYRSFMDTETRDAKGVEPFQSALDRIAAIADHGELAEYFAEASIRNLGAPFGFGQLPDLQDPTTYIMGVFQGGLGLPDREYYLKDDEKSAEIRA
jgi:putative endopeptidase